MINLIRNENMKLARRISTWIMVGILILIIIVTGLIFRFAINHGTNTEWKADLIQQNKDDLETANMQGLPKNTKETILNQIKVNEYSIQHDIQPVQNNTLWGFVKVSSNSIMLISLFAIIIGGGIVANEFSGGTIKLLLIRPSKRWKILVSKYITVILYVIFMLILTFILSFLLGGILFSFKGVSQPFLKYTPEGVVEVNMVAHIIEVYGLKCINLIMMVTLAFTISTAFRNSAMAIGIGVFLLTVGSTVTNLIAQFFTWTWPKYILFANTDLTQYSTGTPLIAGMTMNFSIVVILIYFVIFNVISFLGFTKRDVAA
ncbi:MAG: ABC transporter permease [Clostridiaceae bacterium]|nr:ABC transporter permease [Clostridiaceae bacterium]